MKKFTFKTIKPKGKFKEFYATNYEIYLVDRKVGKFTSEKPHFISFYTEHECVKDSTKHESVANTKLWLNENYEMLINKYDL
jgi:hypothetical protein